jgi:hypothetical protein
MVFDVAKHGCADRYEYLDPNSTRKRRGRLNRDRECDLGILTEPDSRADAVLGGAINRVCPKLDPIG